MMRTVLLILLALSCALSAKVSAQTTKPQDVPIDQRPLTPSGRAIDPTAARSAGSTSNSDLVSIPQLISGLAIVLSLIFGARWLVPRIWPTVAAHRSNAVRVLGRTPISPKNQIVLVQVGQRVLVLGENAGQLATLSTIDNADEIAMLLGKASAASRERDASQETAFAAALDESHRAYDGPPADPAEAAAEPGKQSGELSDLISKVRGLARQLGRS